MSTPSTVRIGLIGSGFIADFYMAGIRDVPGATVVANCSRDAARASAFGARHGIGSQYGSISDLCADPAVQLVVIALPNHAHLEAVRIAAEAGKGIVCTKPLGRTAAEAAEILALVTDAGVMHAYAENEVFTPHLMRARAMVEQGAVGRVLTVRAREGHSGPHAPQFWDAELAGGGALLDMGCHAIEGARYIFGKEDRPTEAFAWGATMAHGDKTTAEDNAVALVKFAGGGMAISEASWTTKGGMEIRKEITGTDGRLITDSAETPVWGFIGNPVDYIVEKADADTGWVYPLPEEAHHYGYVQEMRHFVECFASGEEPRETFHDGYVVNCVLDACYRSIESGRWEPIEIDETLASSPHSS